MADPATYRPAAGTVPDAPGVYRFRDAGGRVIYVGKAKSLRSRLGSYFQDVRALHQRTRTMVESASAVDWVVVKNEVEALQLEYSWIKEFDPRFNVRYRDDKSYPSLAITFDEEYPRAMVMRGPRRKGVRYFGPYSHAWAIRETLDLLLRVFPVRTCSPGVFRRCRQANRPCLLADIGKCSAPCVGRVTPAEHREIAEQLADVLAGHADQHLRRLEKEMAVAAAELEYERAARLRDDLAAVRRAMEKQAVVLQPGTDADVVGLVEDPLEAAVQVFHVRDGRVRGQRGWVVDKVEDLDTPALVGGFLERLYGERPDEVPRTVLVPALPADREPMQAWLAGMRGGPVEIRVPSRGDKRALMETVERNAGQSFTLHKLRRAGDLSARSRALAEIQAALDLPEAPLRIESFDISNLQGTNVVASMVVFEDGLARKSEYRRFEVRTVEGQDDVASMHEVVRRRFARYLAETKDAAMEACLDDETVTTKPAKFAYPPNLLVVDGGAVQVAAAERALAELGITGVSVAGLAKRLEEVWLPGREEPVVLPRASEGLYLLQRIRDEAHRFAIAYHRQKRSRSMTTSALDAVPGLGETRRRALLRKFGSVKRLAAATAEEIAETPGIGPRTALAVREALATHRPAPSVDPATGEILTDD